jgi:hypothetical protein
MRLLFLAPLLMLAHGHPPSLVAAQFIREVDENGFVTSLQIDPQGLPRTIFTHDAMAAAPRAYACPDGFELVWLTPAGPVKCAYDSFQDPQ